MDKPKHAGGRPKGSKNKATVARQAAIAASGLTPLDYMLEVLRSEDSGPEDRKWAAAASAPYVHPKLSAISHEGKFDVTLSHEERLRELDKDDG